MRKMFLIGAILGVCGCTTTSSGIMSFGAGKYSVTSSSEYGLAKAKESALKQASQHCSQQGRMMQPIAQASGVEEGRVASTSATYDLIFSCE